MKSTTAIDSITRLRQTLTERALDILAAMFWTAYAAAYLKKAIIGYGLMDFGLFTYYSLVVWLFINRAPAKRHASWTVTAFALFSMILPVIGLSSSSKGFSIPGTAIQILGLMGMFIASASLGRSFAIAPADRGLRTNGAYRWIRHPLYASELLFYTGYLVANWSWRNAIVFCMAVVFITIRIRYEEQLIAGYHHYAQQVRWRLVPLIW